MRRIISVAPLIVVSVAAAIVGISSHVPNGQITPGVRLADLRLGGRSIDDARSALQSWVRDRNSIVFALRFAPDTGISRIWTPPAEKIGLGIDIDATLESLGKAGKESVLGQVSHWLTGSKPIAVAPQISVDSARLNSYLTNQIGHDIYRKPQRARLTIIENGGLGVHHEVSGLSIDRNASAAAIVAEWTRFNASAGAHPSSTSPSSSSSSTTTPPSTLQPASEINQTDSDQPQSPAATTQRPDATLAVQVEDADVKSEDLSKIDGMLAEFSTYYSGTTNRRSNVVLAAHNIDGTVLRPGEVFSYNKVVGPRDQDYGFLPAPQYVNGKHVMGEGGGICQVSSTLFNAALLANLKIVQRHNHSMPVGYLRHGRDATAVYGALDMQFQNDTDTPIYVHSTAAKNVLTFVIYGKKIPGREVNFVKGAETIAAPPVYIHHDPQLKAGKRVVEEKGSPGITVVWYRVVKQDGNLIKREPFHSHYKAFPTILGVGSKGAPLPDGTSHVTSPKMAPTRNPSLGITPRPVDGEAPQPVRQ